MSFHERRLPHWRPEGRDLFLTWRLHGSLPPNRYISPGGLTTGQAFVWVDRYLDQARYGPTWLGRPEVAQVVAAAFQYGQDTPGHYTLHAYAIMANHAHLLISPLAPPSKILHSLKGYTAREANRLLCRTGQPFWQSESYDHWVRDHQEFDRIKAYIESNPVKAGLVTEPEQFPWSSAGKRKNGEAGLKAGSQA
jgi:putative transposase